MKRLAITALGLAMLGAHAFAAEHASGDADAGETVFNKCKACHSVIDDEGEVVVRGGRNGPNLYGVYQRVAGTADFRYGDSIVEAGEQGLEWDEEHFLQYVADPQDFLEEYLDNSRARSNMSFKLRDEEEAKNVWAYLVSVGPEEAAASD